MATFFLTLTVLQSVFALIGTIAGDIDFAQESIQYAIIFWLAFIVFSKGENNMFDTNDYDPIPGYYDGGDDE